VKNYNFRVLISVAPGTHTTFTLIYTDTNNLADTLTAIVYVSSGSTASPIIIGDKHACDSNSVYTIVNYDSTAIYAWDINNPISNPPQNILMDSTFTINWNNYPNGGLIYVSNICYKPTLFEVFECCDPYTPADSAIYYFNESIISPTIFNNKKIVINGSLDIGANVTFGPLTKVVMGAMSRINVLPGNTLTIDSAMITDTCDYIWDGIYVEDTAALLVTKNSAILKHALNAVVSSNNGGIDLTNTIFEDNITGIKIRKYNPTCILIPNSPPPPAPENHNAKITGCYFINTQNPMPQPSNLVPQTGIQVDTVYGLIIGGYNSINQKNIFEKLRYGVKIIRSDVTLYNNEFIDIQNNSGYPVDNKNHPAEGAIHASIKILPAGNLPAPAFINSFINRHIIVGGNGLKKNIFNKCNFGVYSNSYKSNRWYG